MERRHDIDWLRTIAVWLLVPFHAGCIFMGINWAIVSNEQSPLVTFFVSFLHCWHMPLLFFLAGIGSFYALKKRNRPAFIQERFYRLFVPLVFGMLVIIPPQMYFQRLQEGVFEGSYFAFYPKFFEGLYPDGNFGYKNLWFLFYLFIYSMVCLPLFTTFQRSHCNDAIISALKSLASRPGGLLLLCIPFFPIEALLRVPFPRSHIFIMDWANLLRYGLFYIYGFYYASSPDLAGAISRQRHIWIVVSLVTTIIVIGMRLLVGIPRASYTPEYIIVIGSFFGVGTWAWILCLLSYTNRYLNFDHPVLRRFTPISLPFYIIHQTILIAFGYYILDAGFTIYPAFLIIVMFTFISSWIIADFGIRPWKITQLCFGMKGKVR